MSPMQRLALALGLSMGIGGLAGAAMHIADNVADKRLHPIKTPEETVVQESLNLASDLALGGIGICSLALIGIGTFPNRWIRVSKKTVAPA